MDSWIMYAVKQSTTFYSMTLDIGIALNRKKTLSIFLWMANVAKTLLKSNTHCPPRVCNVLLVQSYYGAVLPRRRPHYVSMLSVCLSVPCLHLEGKRKGLRIRNLVGRVPGTPAPLDQLQGQGVSGGLFSDSVTTNFLSIPTVKYFWKSVNIW